MNAFCIGCHANESWELSEHAWARHGLRGSTPWRTPETGSRATVHPAIHHAGASATTEAPGLAVHHVTSTTSVQCFPAVGDDGSKWVAAADPTCLPRISSIRLIKPELDNAQSLSIGINFEFKVFVNSQDKVRGTSGYYSMILGSELTPSRILTIGLVKPNSPRSAKRGLGRPTTCSSRCKINNR